MYEINRDKQLELLRWLLTAQDAQWLAKTAAVYNPVEASRLNGRVRSTMGRTEMKAILTLVGKNKADNLSDAAQIVQTWLALAYGERGFSGTFRPIQNNAGMSRLEIEVLRFTALDAAKKLAQSSGERPGLVAESFWSAWFETLLPDEQVEISVRSGANNTDIITVAMASANLEEPPVEELSPIAAALQIPFDPVNNSSDSFAASSSAPTPNNATPAPNPNIPQNYPFTSGYVYKPGVEPAAIGYSGPVEMPLSALPPSPPLESKPTMSGSDAGADRRNAGSLNQRLARKTPPVSADKLPPDAPPALQNQESKPPVPAAALRLDPETGRPLFSEDYDETAKRNIEKRKAQQKGLPLVSRLMLSKEAKELMQQGGEVVPIQPFSLTGGIESIFQRLIMDENNRQPNSITTPAHVVDGPEGDLQIHVGTQVYGSVDEVPPGRIRELLQEAVARWMESQGN